MFGTDDEVVSVLDQPRQTFGADDEVVDEPNIPNPIEIDVSARAAFDISEETGLPLNESQSLSDYTPKISAPQKVDGLAARLGKKFYNDLIPNMLKETVYDIGGGRVESYVMAYLLNKKMESKGLTPPSIWQTQKMVKAGTLDQLSKLIPVPEFGIEPPASVPEKVIDAVAGIAAFTAQIAALKRIAPSMPESLVWETVNLSNGGMPGGGAAMQLSLGGISKLIPGKGLTPAAGRAGAASALFGTTTYIGGGDTTDILINMGIPFAFEGLGITKQGWQDYKNKGAMIDALRQKAPALLDKPVPEIEQAVSDILPAEPVVAEPVKPAVVKPVETVKPTVIETKPAVIEPVKPSGSPVEAKTIEKAAVAGQKAATPLENEFVKFEGIQEGLPEEGIPDMKLYTLKQDIAGHPAGSTLAESTLREAGIELPAVPVAKQPVQTIKPETGIKEAAQTAEELTPSRLAERTEELAIEKRITDNLGELAGYEKTPNFMANQAKMSKAEMDRNYAQAKEMALGRIAPPSGLRPASIYEAVKFRATMERDVVTLRELATESTVPTRLSELGQEIKAADVRNPEDPVRAMTDVITTAEKSYETKTGKKVKVVKREGIREIKELIKKEGLTRKVKTWEDFIHSLEC
ncbi:MAG: hypothetical protein PHF37_09685 [Phycisphaerae bacterium]|nr:hypothetical protein [Phycisphaerae bacterium]